MQIIFFLYISEAVAQRGSVKEVFLKISQNSQENTCVGVSTRSLLFIYIIFLQQSSQRRVKLIVKFHLHYIADSNFFRFHTMNYFTYLLPWIHYSTEMILRTTLIKYYKQSLDGSLENNERINMLFALLAFLNLWLKNLKKACEAAYPCDPQMQLLGFLIKQI